MAKNSGFETAANLTRHAKAIYDIIRAAMQGGWAGAALAAAKHYWPQILIISFISMFMPMIIFISLPSLIFNSSFDDTGMTVDEMILDYYSEYQLMADNKIDNLRNEFELSLTSETDENITRIYSGDVELSGEIMDMYWFTAIHTVYNKNENPSTEQIESFTKYLFTTSTYEEEIEKKVIEYEPDDETGVTPPPDITLYINRKLTISHIEPYLLMEQLNFSKVDIEWAEFLYSNMTKERGK